MEAQITDTILMVRPAHFGYNHETAANNAFQSNETDLSQKEISEAAKKEFDNMVSVLRSKEIRVIVWADSDTPHKTDAVFPNNWFSTHAGGQMFLFPMFSPNRRQERDPALIQMLVDKFSYVSISNLLSYEKSGAFLEGTGSMILDRPNKIVYACYSERTHISLLENFAAQIAYRTIGFHATDSEDLPVYHTNVIMTLGEDFSIICTESIKNEDEKKLLLKSLKNTGKMLVDISLEQVGQFAGNMLQLKNIKGEKFVIMSSQAHNCLTTSQINILEKSNKIVHVPLYMIEKFGGGSARCMIAEIFHS